MMGKVCPELAEMDENLSRHTQNIMTDSYLFQQGRRSFATLRTGLLFAFALFVAVPAQAQSDGGDAGFNTTAKVNSSGAGNANRLGTLGTTDDGVTQVGAFIVGGTAYFRVNASVIGNLHVWIDEDNDADFTDQSRHDFAVIAGNNHIAVPLGGTTAGSRWFRFIFEGGTNVITTANTDHSTTGLNNANGEIEDTQFTVLAAASAVSFTTTAGGLTTTAVRTGADVVVSDGTNTIFKAPIANIGSLTINGFLGLTDNFVVNMTTGDPIPSGGLTVNGLLGADSDVLTLIDGSNNATVTHNFTNATDGSVVVTDGTINYLGLAPITDNVPATARIFNFNANAETIILDDDAGAGNNIGTIDSNFGEIVTFDVSSTTSITINAGAGNDVIIVRQVDSAYSGTIDVNGQADSDELRVDFASGDPIPGAGTGITFDGGAGDLDKIKLDGSELQVNVVYTDTGAEAGTIQNDNGTLTYSNVEGGITDETPATNRRFAFTQPLALTLEVDDETGAGDTTDKMVSSQGQDIVYSSPVAELRLDAGPGDDTIIVNDLDNNFTGTILVNGEAGNDVFYMDWESNADSPLGGIVTITYDGGPNTDSMQLINGTVGYVTHTYADAFSGSVEVAAASDGMTYLNIEPIFDGLVATTRTFNFSGVSDQIWLDNAFTGTTSRIVTPSPNLAGGSVTSETTEFNDVGTTSVIINGGGGNDEFDIEPSAKFASVSNGDGPTTLPGDQFTLNVASLPADEKITLTEGSNTSGTYAFSKQGGGASVYKDVSYTTMEQVTLRYSDPNAYPGATYPGDWTYPVNTESGISIEPYFNWDIEINQALPGGHPSKYTSLRLDVSLNANLSSPVWFTTTKEDGVTPLISSAANEDHYITDIDRDAITPYTVGAGPYGPGIPLLNNTNYFWGLSGTMTAGQVFCQIMTFKTVQDLKPTLDYPSEDLTLYDLDIQFDWNVASPVEPDVYWRMELDNTTGAAFKGDVPLTVEGLLLGEGENDNDKTFADGFAPESVFKASDLPTPLVWGTQYAWRVTTMWPAPPTGWVPQEIFDKNETDRLVSVSKVGEFKTLTKALVPTLTYPVGGLTIYDNEPNLSWNVAAPFLGLTFTVEIREGSNAGPLVCSSPIAGVSGLQYDTANCTVKLLAGKTYFWQVNSTDGTSTSAFSGWQSFSILGNGAASAAFPSYPIGNLEIYTTSPTFHWFTATAATGLNFVTAYLERVPSTNPVPSCTTIFGTGLKAPAAGTVSVTQVPVTGLEPGATYDWCVKTTGTNGTFDSGVASFVVAGGTTKGAPKATWPIGNPTTYNLSQDLHWSVEGASLGISEYNVEYCKNAPLGSGGPACTTVTGITTMQYQITGLNYGDVVLWRVKAKYINGASDSAWSNGGFTVTGSLNTLSAVLTYPVNGLIVYASNLQLNWYVNGATLPSGALSFQVQWSYAQSFPTIGAITQTATTTNPYYDVTNLIPGHTYWWRVRISLDGGSTYGGWSTVGTFDITPDASAPMPRLGSPISSVTVATTSPVLSWLIAAPSTSTVSYDLYLSTQPDLANATVYSGLTDSQFRVSDLADGEYYWAVLSKSSDGTTSALSTIGSFSSTGGNSTGIETVKEVETPEDVETSDSVDDAETDDQNKVKKIEDDSSKNIEDEIDQVIPTDFDLKQNYPNPFNPTTTIEFQMAQTTGVSIRVYNVLGQVVKTLVNGTYAPGVYRVNWDATDDSGVALRSGLYLYQMVTDEFTSVKSLVLMK